MRKLSRSCPKSEAVPLRQPVVPVSDRLDSGFVHVGGSYLGGWHRDIAGIAANQQQHVVGTGIFRCQAADLDPSPLAEGRDYFGGHAPSRERKLDFVLQVVVPAES